MPAGGPVLFQMAGRAEWEPGTKATGRKTGRTPASNGGVDGAHDLSPESRGQRAHTCAARPSGGFRTLALRALGWPTPFFP